MPQAFVGAVSLLALAMLGGCGTTYMSQETWVAEMRATYPPGTPADAVETSVSNAGMSFAEAPEAFRTLPRSITGDGSGYWRRVTKLETSVGCDQGRTVYFHFDDADRLIAVYQGDSRCL